MAGEVTNENEFVAVPFQTEISWDELKKDASGLVPCIVQDYKTGQVLMLAYMNEAAYLETAATGTMCYYSRSRKSRWLKGETSGHFQYVKSLYADCDKDTLLAKVAQKGAACHTGSYSINIKIALGSLALFFILPGILQYDCTERKKRGKIGQEKQDWRK